MYGSRRVRRAGGVALLVSGLVAVVAALAEETPPTGEQERDLVRKVHQARDDYQASLERLRAFYVHTSNQENRAWVERELTEFHLVVKNPYLLDLDLPSADLRPDTSLPKANRIFREALDWMNRRALTDSTRNSNYKRAELLFRRLLRDYPRSDKLDDTCYRLGEIYSSKHYQQYRRAVAYYERVFHYEPNTNLDARLRAAVLYEKYIQDRGRAVQLYQEVLQREIDPAQTKEARRRLDDLLGTRTANRQ